MSVITDAVQAMRSAGAEIKRLRELNGELVEALEEAQKFMLLMGWAIQQRSELREAYAEVVAAIQKAKGERIG